MNSYAIYTLIVDGKLVSIEDMVTYVCIWVGRKEERVNGYIYEHTPCWVDVMNGRKIATEVIKENLPSELLLVARTIDLYRQNNMGMELQEFLQITLDAPCLIP